MWTGLIAGVTIGLAVIGLQLRIEGRLSRLEADVKWLKANTHCYDREEVNE